MFYLCGLSNKHSHQPITLTFFSGWILPCVCMKNGVSLLSTTHRQEVWSTGEIGAGDQSSTRMETDDE